MTTINEFPVLTANGQPFKLTGGPDGNVWFTELEGNVVGRITPAGVVTEFPIPTPSSHPEGITTGPDGNLWFVENGPTSGSVHSKIGRITPAGAITEFTIGTFPSSPTSIATGSDGNLWFTEFDSNRIGRITPTGTITEFPIPGSETEPEAIAAGPDGNLWFTENNGLNIGRITTGGSITLFPSPPLAYTDFTEAITAGPDGNLWFTDSDDHKIGRITPSGSITTFPLPAGGAGLLGISSGPDGNLWIANRNFNKIDQITPTGVVTSFPIPTPTSNPTGVTTGPDRNIWFVESTSGKIGQLVLGADLALSGTATGSVTLGQNVTFPITVTNTGTTGATGVKLTDTLPPGATFVSATGGVTPVDGVLSFTIGNVAAGASVSFNVVVTPTAAGPLTNIAAVSGNEADPTPADNTLHQTTTVTAPATKLVVTTEPPGSVLVGGHFGLTVSAESVSGAVDTSYNNLVTLAIATGPTGGTLGGTLMVHAVNGVATFSDLTLSPAGVYTIGATSDELAPATTTPITVQANALPTNTTISSSAASSSFGQAVTFTAIVTGPPDVETPTGIVTFLDGTTALGTGTLNASGKATFTTSSLAVGMHSITASYGGGPNFLASASPALPQQVSSLEADGPRVSSVQRFGFHALPTLLVLTFNRPLDRARAENVSAYTIIGPHGKAVAIGSATYDSAAHAVRIAPLHRLDLHQVYRLTVLGTGSSGLTDTSGRLLDGAGTGHPGSDYQASVTAANLVFGAAVPGGSGRLARFRKAVARMAVPEPAVLAAHRVAGHPKAASSHHA